MKDTIVSYKRWLSMMIGGFGCLCLARAAFCAYMLKHLSVDGIMANDAIVAIKNTQELALVSIVVFSLVATISIVSAIGIFLNKAWATKVWLFTTVFISAYILFAFYNNPSDWLDYLTFFILSLYSWFILWYLPRKHAEAIS
jgi:magnesium-transporting ATPase (P-type)